jgi:hypothetical protein
MHRFRVFVALAAYTAVLIGAPAADAAPQKHCVVTVLGEKPSHEFRTTPRACFPTWKEAMDATGIPGAANRIAPGVNTEELQEADAVFAASGEFIIGVHYDGFGLSGSSLTVVGVDCSGGYLNTSSYGFSNVISSTANGCYNVAHYDNANLGGAGETTTGFGGNLSSLNNRTESIQYF